MKLSARALNRATLARQMLLGREPLGAADAVRRVVALQAQHPPSPYLALWNRVTGFDPADLDAAFATGQVVRATLMRITMHAVHAADFPVFREAMEPTLRRERLGNPRFTASGLTLADADALLPGLLDFASQPRTSAECEAWLEKQLGAPLGRPAWRMLRQYSPLCHAPTGGAWSFNDRQSFAAPATRPALLDPAAPARALPVLIRRYIEGFGPASVPDMAQFTLVGRGRVTAAMQALGDDLEQLEGPDGEVLYDVPGGPRPDEDTPAPPRLMAMWDSVLMAYHDRSRVFPPGYRKQVIRTNGDVLPTLLVDGFVAGVWRAAGGAIEATAFDPLPDQAWAGLAEQAQALLPVLADRDPAVYSRYGHWWAKLPAATTRLLAG